MLHAERWFWSLLLAAALHGAAPVTADPAANRVAWERWEPETFARAAAERRIVLVVVSTSWCHWCHVMQRETYADPAIERTLARAFLPIKEDADDRPDLAERFRAYRWPATVFLTADGRPILALRGHRSAADFGAVLADVDARVKRGGPFPGVEGLEPPRPTRLVLAQAADLRALRGRLVAQLDAAYDAVHQGWGRGQKYPLAEPVEWGLRRARTNPQEALALRRALDTLAASEALLDPVWGGMFQYSVGPDWNVPHHEKLVDVNAGALVTYAQAHALTGDARWARDAQRVAAWFQRFHDHPTGTFFASQDAEVNGREASDYYRRDAAGRRAIGMPRMDRHVYARENGLAIRAWAIWGGAGGGTPALDRARRAMRSLLSTHALPSGLFKHQATDDGRRVFLLDQAEMGRALVALARIDGEIGGKTDGQRAWREAAGRLAEGLVTAFRAPEGDFHDVLGDGVVVGVLGRGPRSLEANAAAARFLLDAALLVDRPVWREVALRALSAQSDPAYLESHWRYVGGMLLAVDQALSPPRRVTLFGDPDDARLVALRQAAVAAARRDPDLWVLSSAAPAAAAPFAVLCAPDGTCSDPLSEPWALSLALTGR